jgi:hypothetical protein
MPRRRRKIQVEKHRVEFVLRMNDLRDVAIWEYLNALADEGAVGDYVRKMLYEAITEQRFMDAPATVQDVLEAVAGLAKSDDIAELATRLDDMQHRLRNLRTVEYDAPEDLDEDEEKQLAAKNKLLGLSFTDVEH